MSVDVQLEAEAELMSFVTLSLNDLQSDELGRRKRALQDLNKYLFSGCSRHSLLIYQKIFSECHLQILKCFRDKSEMCRELSISLMANLIKELDLNDFYLTYIFPVIVERIGSVELIEESEELRLELILFLSTIINRYSKTEYLIPFLNDTVQILCQTVIDKFPKAREASCICVMELAEALPRHFHLQSESLVKPVLKSFSHQHYKIRIASIKTIGVIILHSTSSNIIENTVGPIAERLFDQTATVRQTVAQVATQLLTEYRDRYSFFHRLLPLILTGLCDEVPETRLEVEKLWEKIGDQYVKENEKELKDQLDFPVDAPEHYPADMRRPSLGCRVLVQRNASKMLSGVCNELTSWQDDIRVRCAQLLCVIVLHCEQFATQGLQDVLPAMYAACELQRDQMSSVHENVMRAARYAGAFVPVKAWSALVIPATVDAPTCGHLRILRSMAFGTPPTDLQEVVIEIGDILASESVRCSSRKSQYLIELIECCRIIVSFPEVSSQVFTTLVTVIALCNPRNINTEITNIVGSAVVILNQIQDPEVHVGMLLNELNAFGNALSPDRCVLNTLLFDWNKAIVLHLPLLKELLIKALDEPCDPEARLTTFEALSSFLQTEILTQMSAAGDIGLEIGKFATDIIKDVLLPAVIWRAGRTAEALRTAAATCLSRALQHALVDLVAEDDDLALLVSTLVALTDDAAWLTRLNGTRALCQLGYLLRGDEARQRRWANEAAIALLKRMDDPHEMVRLRAMATLCDVLHEPNLLEPQNLKHLVDTVLIHVDDHDEETMDAAIKILKTVGRSDWTYLNEKLQSDMHLFRNIEACEELISFLNSSKNYYVLTDSVDNYLTSDVTNLKT